MKKFKLLLVSFCLILLCGCSGQADIVGTWRGDGTLDVLGEDAPFEYAEALVFSEDGTVIVERSASRTELDYSLTDDTLTFTKDDVAIGIGYQQKGNTLTIQTGGDSTAVFTREAS